MSMAALSSGRCSVGVHSVRRHVLCMLSSSGVSACSPKLQALPTMSLLPLPRRTFQPHHLSCPQVAPRSRRSAEGRELSGCRLTPRQPERCGCRHRPGQQLRQAQSAGVLGREGFQAQEPEPPREFPRRRERDPYKLLGVPRDAAYEEVQDARNFLFESYRAHAPSREAIEMAFDRVLKTSYEERQKHGFRPPKMGRRTDAAAKPRLTLAEQLRSRIEPSVPGTTLINDGSIYLAMGAWAAVSSAAAQDPTLPIVFSFGYSVYSFVRKRKLRNPEGPYLGDNPLWGSLASSLGALALSGVVFSTVLPRLPLPSTVPVEAVSLFLINACIGAITIFVR